MKQDELNTLTPKLEAAFQKALEEVGLKDYELDSYRLTPKSDTGATPNACVRKCVVIGKPPHSHVFCYFDCKEPGSK